MQRSGRYRNLFHKVWTQPIGSQSEAIPIVLDQSGDDEYWPALQGTITLYVSRYLYLETNLWLNTAEWHNPVAAGTNGVNTVTIDGETRVVGQFAGRLFLQEAWLG